MTAISLVVPDSQKFRSNYAMSSFVVVADHTTLVDVGFVDMRDFSEFTVRTVAVALTGDGVDQFTIVVNTASDGTGDEAILKTHLIGSLPDAVNDGLVLSVTAAEIAHQGNEDGKLYRHVSAKFAAANASDDHVVVYVRTAKHSQLDLTADSIA